MQTNVSSLRLAILGTRGVPPRYGGFETFAAELGRRLATRGHEVTVYCRGARPEDRTPEWEGIRRIDLPSLRHKYLETVSHTFLSAIDAWRRSFDLVLVCNAANAFVLPMLRAGGKRVAINVDGIERRRKKWNAAGRFFYLLGEALSVRFADRLVADAEIIASYYRRTWGAGSEVIAYGSEFPAEEDSDVLARLGVEPEKYLLYVSRIEPENNPLPVLRSYLASGVEIPLVMVGSAPYAPALWEALEREQQRAEPGRVILPGGLYGADYRTLQRRALLYVQATEVGGTHPALIEAMRSGGAVLALDTPENREVGGDSVRYFTLQPEETLSRELKESVDDPATLSVYRTRARSRSAGLYGWDGITDRYERLFFELAGKA
jgi:glycosyltransferase involved in cell wall biosynthesis